MNEFSSSISFWPKARNGKQRKCCSKNPLDRNVIFSLGSVSALNLIMSPDTHHMVYYRRDRDGLVSSILISFHYYTKWTTQRPPSLRLQSSSAMDLTWEMCWQGSVYTGGGRSSKGQGMWMAIQIFIKICGKEGAKLNHFKHTIIIIIQLQIKIIINA